MERFDEQDEEDREILELKARAQDGINTFFEDNPTADWVWVGEDTATVYGGGADEELPTPEAAEVFEQEKGEKM